MDASKCVNAESVNWKRVLKVAPPSNLLGSRWLLVTPDDATCPVSSSINSVNQSESAKFANRFIHAEFKFEIQVSDILSLISYQACNRRRSTCFLPSKYQKTWHLTAHYPMHTSPCSETSSVHGQCTRGARPLGETIAQLSAFKVWISNIMISQNNLNANRYGIDGGKTPRTQTNSYEVPQSHLIEGNWELITDHWESWSKVSLRTDLEELIRSWSKSLEHFRQFTRWNCLIRRGW